MAIFLYVVAGLMALMALTTGLGGLTALLTGNLAEFLAAGLVAVIASVFSAVMLWSAKHLEDDDDDEASSESG